MQETRQVLVPAALVQQRILLTLGELFYCTNEQIRRRWYKPGCIASIWRNIAILEREKLIAYEPRLLSRKADGRAQRIYYLTPKGRKVVEAMGLVIPLKQLPGGQKKYIYQEHTLAVNDMHCAIREFERESDALDVVTAIPDAILKRDPLAIADSGKSVKIIPDSWFHLAWHGREIRFWVEIDRGTEAEDAIRRKVAGIIKGHKLASAKWGGTGFRAVYIVSPADPRLAGRRLATILTWMEKELEKTKEWGGFFLVAGVNPATVSGKNLLTASWFVSPFDRTPRPLLRAPTMA